MHIDKRNLLIQFHSGFKAEKEFFSLHLKIFPVTVYQKELGYFTVATHSLTLPVYCRYLLNPCFNELLDHFSKEHTLNQRAQRSTVPKQARQFFCQPPPCPSSTLLGFADYFWVVDGGTQAQGCLILCPGAYPNHTCFSA